MECKIVGEIINRKGNKMEQKIVQVKTEEVDYIAMAIQSYNVTDAYLNKVKQESLAIKVSGPDDNDNCIKAHKLRMLSVKKRGQVENRRKELNAESVKFCKAMNVAAKHISVSLEEDEAYLQSQEDIVAKEKERLRLLEEEKAHRKLQVRVGRLKTYNHTMYLMDVVKNMSDVEFETEVNKARIVYETEQTRLIEENKQKQIEAGLLAKIKADQEIENARLVAVARQQLEAENRIKAEQKKIDDEKRLIAETKLKEEQEKDRLIALEKARQEAVKKAIIETENRIKRKTEAKLEAERLAEIEAKRQEALKPDKEKLLKIASMIQALIMPELFSQEAKNIANRATIALMKIVEFIQTESNKL